MRWTLALALGLAGCRTAATTPASHPHPAGCYQVAMGRLSPELELGRDSELVRLPDRVVLQEELMDGFGDRFGVAAGPGSTPPAPGLRTSWSSDESGHIVLEQSNGFSGMRLDLSAIPEGFRGKAETFWDFVRPGQHADVELRRTDCRAPDGAPRR